MSESTLALHRLYTPGGPVQLDKSLYVERQADRDILAHLRRGEYVYILSTRQVGKTSLIKCAARELQAEGVLSVNIDLNQLGTVTTPEQWYLGIITRVARKMLPDFEAVDWWNAKAHLNDTDRFSRFFDEVLLERKAERIVIFIDEIDTTFKLPFSDDFFAAIRAMHNQRGETPALERLSFVLVGVANKNDLISDAQRTPFNIAFPVELTDFTFEEALPLAEGFGLPDHEARQTLRWALDWTGGHPFLTQRLCRAIAGAGRDRWTESNINELVNEVFLKEAEKDSNLRAVRDLLLERAPDKEAVLRVYRDVLRGKRVTDEERSPIKSHLKLAGVVRADHRNRLVSRNRVYQHAFDLKWVQEHLPVDYRERFRVMRYAAMGLLALLLLTSTGLSIYAWTKKTQAEEFARREKIAADKEREARTDAEKFAKREKIAADNERAARIEAVMAAGKAKQAAENEKQAASSARQSEAKAVESSRVADEQQQRADEQSKIATSRELASHARSTMHAEPDLSFQLAARAVNFAPTSQAIETLREALPQTFLQAELVGHTATVNNAQFSPDGQRVVTASNDRTARVWEAATGKLIAELRGHTAMVNNAQFSADGQRIVTASDDRTARVWEATTGKLIAQLKGHTDSVSSAQFSANGQWVITATRKIRLGSTDSTACVWEATTGKLIAELKGHTDVVYSAQFSPDGQRIVTASYDRTVRIWEAATGKLITQFKGRNGSVYSVQFSPDGQRVVTSSEHKRSGNPIASTMGSSDNLRDTDNTARVWEAVTGKLIAELKGHNGSVYSAQFSADGLRVVTASSDRTARVWEATTGKLIAELKGHNDKVYSAQFSADGQRVVTASDDRTAHVWEATTGKLIAELKGHNGLVYSAQFSADGQRVVTASDDHTARVWEVAIARFIAELKGHTAPVLSAQFSADGQRVVTASGNISDNSSGNISDNLRSTDYTARVWEAATGKSIAELKGHTALVRSAQFSPDGQRVVTSSYDHTASFPNYESTARVWEAATGKIIAELKGHTAQVRSAQFSPDGQWIVTASDDRTARVWEAATGKTIAELKGHTAQVRSAQFSPDGQRVVTSSSDRTARVWEAATGKSIAELKGHTALVYSAQFSPDGQRVVTASDDRTARIWEAATGKSIAELKGHTALVYSARFSPDGQRVVTASDDNTARVWEAATGKLVAELKGHTDWVNSVQFSPDGQRVVTSSSDRTARVWEAATGKLIAELKGHTAPVRSAQFSADGQWIVTASEDHTAIIYPYEMFAPFDEILSRARRRTLREFTPEERARLRLDPSIK
jgi:WD40 repeat protein